MYGWMYVCMYVCIGVFDNDNDNEMTMTMTMTMKTILLNIKTVCSVYII